jgi:hypothetical protein
VSNPQTIREAVATTGEEATTAITDAAKQLKAVIANYKAIFSEIASGADSNLTVSANGKFVEAEAAVNTAVEMFLSGKNDMVSWSVTL